MLDTPMLDAATLRRQFPAYAARPDAVFLDGPAGTQVPRRVIDAMVDALTRINANHGGAFATSRESDAMLDRAHDAVADFLGAASGDEIIFGANMTTLTFHLSRSLGRTWKPGDEVMVTRLDHDANVTPWVLAARDAGAAIRWIDLHPDDGTLDLDTFRRQLSDRTRLVAVGLASNILGTINDVGLITREAHRAGAEVFIDAVHFAPHGPIDVTALGCDFLACSAYKFFGPHVGILWGKRERLHELQAYKVRPAPNELPGKWMTGTQNHEGIAGVAAAIDYLASLVPARDNRKQTLFTAMNAIQHDERILARRLLEGLAARPQFSVWGIRNLHRLGERVPTVAITDRTRSPRDVAEHLGRKEIYVWNGNNYALEASERLGLEPHGVVRLGMVHTNSIEDIDRTLHALDELP